MRDEGPTTDLLSQLPGVDMDDVALRRLRQRVLDDVAGGEVAPPAPAGLRKRFAIPAVIVSLIAGTLVLRPWQRAAEPARPFVADVFTSGDGEARWSRRVSDGTEWIALSEGRFHIRIGEHGPGRRVAVEVPDGHIDDLGTTFDVVVSGARTTRVVVEEGSVVLRLTGEPAVTLLAGQVWEHRHEAVDIAPPAAPVTVPPPSSSHPASRAVGRRHPGTGPSPREIDRRAEDEAYLNVLRLLRGARRAEAQQAARDYLRRFPDGFRREELGGVLQ